MMSATMVDLTAAPPLLGIEDKRRWTVARCNRLLRPLTTSLKRLRSELSANTLRDCNRDGDVSHKSVAAKREALESRSCLSKKRKRISVNNLNSEDVDNDDSADTDWDWSAVGKRPRRQYSTAWRKVHQSRKADRLIGEEHISRNKKAPGSIIMPSPLVVKSISEGFSTSDGRENQSPIQARTYDYPHTAKKTKSRWSGFKTTGRSTVLDEVIKAFSNILEATKELEASKLTRFGAKSLLSMCIRKIPDYIAEEAYWQKLDNENDESDITEEIYSELEAFGSSAGTGWKHFRPLVRAQSIFMLQDLIEDLRVDSDTIHGFLSVCYEQKAFDEAAQLITSFASISLPLTEPSPNESDMETSTTAPLLTLLSRHVRKSEQSGFRYRVMSDLVSSGALPLQWLVSKAFEELYVQALFACTMRDQTLTQPANCFLTSTIVRSCEEIAKKSGNRVSKTFRNSRGSKGLRNRLWSLCAELVCWTICRCNANCADVDSPAFPLRNASAEIFASYYDEHFEHRTKGQGVSIFHKMVLVSNLILQLLDVRSAGKSTCLTRRYLEILATPSLSSQPLSSSPGWSEDLIACEIDDMVWLLRSLVDTYGQARRMLSNNSNLSEEERTLVESDEAFTLLKDFTTQLISFASDNKHKLSERARLFAQRLVLESAVRFARDYPNQDYDRLTRDIEEIFRNHNNKATISITSPQQVATGANQRRDVKWRFDEGICEFVAATPRLPSQRSRVSLAQIKTKKPIAAVGPAAVATVVVSIPSQSPEVADDRTCRQEQGNQAYQEIMLIDKPRFTPTTAGTREKASQATSALAKSKSTKKEDNIDILTDYDCVYGSQAEDGNDDTSSTDGTEDEDEDELSSSTPIARQPLRRLSQACAISINFRNAKCQSVNIDPGLFKRRCQSPQHPSRPKESLNTTRRHNSGKRVKVPDSDITIDELA